MTYLYFLVSQECPLEAATLRRGMLQEASSMGPCDRCLIPWDEEEDPPVSSNMACWKNTLFIDVIFRLKSQFWVDFPACHVWIPKGTLVNLPKSSWSWTWPKMLDRWFTELGNLVDLSIVRYVNVSQRVPDLIRILGFEKQIWESFVSPETKRRFGMIGNWKVSPEWDVMVVIITSHSDTILFCKFWCYSAWQWYKKMHSCLEPHQRPCYHMIRWCLVSFWQILTNSSVGVMINRATNHGFDPP